MPARRLVCALAALMAAVVTVLSAAATTDAAVLSRPGPPDPGQRTEAVSERTETSSTFINADGTRTTQLHTGPVHVADGTGWRPVDLTLRRSSSGSVEAAAHPRQLWLAGAGGEPGRPTELARLRHGAMVITAHWPGPLPEPVLTANRAVYPQVRPGVDLMVTATRLGFTHTLLVAGSLDRSAQDETTALALLPVKADGVRLLVEPDGARQLVDQAGSVVGTVPNPTVHDLRHDPIALRHQDPTTHPVTVSAGIAIGPILDTYVQSNIRVSSMAQQPDLRLGTYDGTTVARSILNWELGFLGQRPVLDAKLTLWNWHSWSCRPFPWQIWETDPAVATTVWDRQPAWKEQLVSTTLTRGYAKACPDDSVAVNVTVLAQSWAAQGLLLGGMGLRAENEANTFEWKKFSSAQATEGHPPRLEVTY